MITKLKSGFTWELKEDGVVSMRKETTFDNSGSIDWNRFDLDKVGQYSLLCFLIRVLRHRKVR